MSQGVGFGLMTCALAPIDVKDFASHEGCRLEVKDRANDVGDFAHMADGVQGIKLRIRVDGFIGDLMIPGATAFTLIPRLAYSIASDLVAAARPPFVSDASTEGTPAIA